MADFVQKKLQVFVSSTFLDLTKERQAAVESILTAGHIPAGMELFTPGDESQLDVIKQWIDESDVYLLILGGRYGSLEPKTGKSYTQLEYEYAVSLGKPLFACVLKEEAFDARVKTHGKAVLESENPQKMKEFRSTVLTKTCRFWEDFKDIKIAVADTLSRLSRRDSLVGWVRPIVQADLPAIAGELTRLSKENADLRDYSKDFRSLTSLYTKAKSFILNAQQIDPESRSMIATLKEISDAADHVMRILADIHDETSKGVESNTYVQEQFANAKGHLLRAAFDSLDAIGVNCKVRLNEALKGVSIRTVHKNYPEYSSLVAAFNELDEISAGRGLSSGERSLDQSLIALEDYARMVYQASALTQAFIQRSQLPRDQKPSKWRR